MKKQQIYPIPASQRELAAYIGISGTLMNMAYTGRHGNRRLNNAASARLTDLTQAHVQAQQPGAPDPTLEKLQERAADSCARTVIKMRGEIRYAEAHVVVLEEQLKEIKEKEQQGRQWLRTVDLFLTKLSKTKGSANDLVWFKFQQQKVLKTIEKNGLTEQIKLELKIETEKAKVIIYKKMIKKLLKP
jgi:hypothetical protein